MFRSFYNYREDLVKSLSPLMIDMAGDETCDESYIIKRTNTDISVLIYIEEGEGLLEIEGSEEKLYRGDVFTLKEGETYCYKVSKANPFRILWFNMKGNLYLELLEQYNISRIERQVSNVVRQKFFDAMNICQSNLDVQHRLCVQVFDILLSLKEAKKEIVSIEGRLHHMINLHIEQNIESALPLDDMCTSLSMSRRHLERLFKASYKQSPHQYFLEQKLSLAKQYLVYTRLSVKEIASILGYYDAYHFSKVYKKETGLSPSEYRKLS